jgi:hypothetical protein
MPHSFRPGFLPLVWRFLMTPSTWIGGVGAAVVLLFAGDIWPGAAVPGAIAVIVGGVALEFAIDRRRGYGRRLLYRGPTVSRRRTFALLVSIGLIASVTAAFVARMGWNIRQGTESEVRRQSMPNRKRGYY